QGILSCQFDEAFRRRDDEGFAAGCRTSAHSRWTPAAQLTHAELEPADPSVHEPQHGMAGVGVVRRRLPERRRAEVVPPAPGRIVGIEAAERGESSRERAKANGTCDRGKRRAIRGGAVTK